MTEASPVEIPELESAPGAPPLVLDPRTISPELLLVDPELAALARTFLPGVPRWTPAAPKPEVAPAPAPEPEPEPAPAPEPEPEPEELVPGTAAPAGPRPRKRRRVIRVGHALLIFAAAFAATLGVVEADRYWRSTTRPSARSSSSVPVPRRLAWAPTADASGYAVRVRQANRTVFVAAPTRPTVTAPLAPGDYRWTVRVVGGRSDGRLVVDAQLVVYPSQ